VKSKNSKFKSKNTAAPMSRTTWFFFEFCPLNLFDMSYPDFFEF